MSERSFTRAAPRGIGVLLVVGLLAGVLAPLDAGAQSPVVPDQERRADSLDPAERLYGLSLIWKEAAYNFPYFAQLPELDWDEAYQGAVPRVLAAESMLQYYRELQRFIALLEDGHTRIELPDSIIRRRPFSSPSVELEAVGGRALVRNVATELADSLPIGSEIVEVEGLSVDAYIGQHVLPYVYASAPHKRRATAIEGSHSRGYGLLVGPAGTDVRLTVRHPPGERVSLTLARDRFRAPREWVRDSGREREPLLELEWPQPGIAYLALNSFSDARLVERLDSLLPELRRAEGIVVDLRRNGGGNDVIAAAILSRFTDRPLVGTSWRVRVHDAYYRALGSFGRSRLERALPAGDSALVERALLHFAGDAWRQEEPDTLRPAFEGERLTAQVAILIGRGTASAAENLLVRLPEGDRFLTVGSPTAASTGQPLLFRLPGGGMGQIVTRAVLLPDGNPLVKTGVVPDVSVHQTPQDMRQGRDSALERAIEKLKGGGVSPR